MIKFDDLRTLRAFADERQRQVYAWAVRSFGPTTPETRVLRFLEEAIELFQSISPNDEQIAHALLSRVFNRPPGDRRQELGGASITLQSVAEAVGESLYDAGETEFQRVLGKSQEHWDAREAEKAAAGFGYERKAAVP